MESFTKLPIAIPIPIAKSVNQVIELRDIYDQLESTVRNLKTLNIEMQTYGSFLVSLLLHKLSNELKMIMSRKFKNDVWQLTEVFLTFKEELEAKERCTFSSNPCSKNEDDILSKSNS